MNLNGKKVIVTGGVSGLGRSMVDGLLSRNAVVSIFDIDLHGLEALKAQHPDVHVALCDVSDYSRVSECVAAFHEAFGSADVLINNAGVLHSAPLVRFTGSGVEKHDIDVWDRILKTDLSSVFYMSVCVIQKMILTRTKGVIVNISSVSASGNAGQSAYSAAKAGVNALTATWAKELGPMGIRVVAVAPGFTDTESTSRAMSENTLQDVVKKVPLRRLGKPGEIADGVMSVIENDFFNGKVLELDGGLVI
jgi:3-oxoacyl-[acyl-carrier protein] reductase